MPYLPRQYPIQQKSNEIISHIKKYMSLRRHIKFLIICIKISLNLDYIAINKIKSICMIKKHPGGMIKRLSKVLIDQISSNSND